MQALLFVLPCFVWRSMNSHSGIDVSNIIQASEVFHQADKIEKREKTLGTIVQVMHRYSLNYYRPHTEYEEGNVFTGVCLSTEGVCILWGVLPSGGLPEGGSALGGAGLLGERSAWRAVCIERDLHGGGRTPSR